MDCGCRVQIVSPPTGFGFGVTTSWLEKKAAKIIHCSKHANMDRLVEALERINALPMSLEAYPKDEVTKPMMFKMADIAYEALTLLQPQEKEKETDHGN